MKRILLVAVLAAAFAFRAEGAGFNPLSPTSLQQFQSDGTTAIAQGGSVVGTTVVLRAVVNTTDPQAQLRIEVKPVGTAYTGIANATSPLTNNGQTASLTISGLAPGTYKWQAWIFCTWGTEGPKVQFGPSDPDFIVPAGNQPPASPAALGQFRSDNVTPLAIGANVVDGTVIIKATLTDPDSNPVKLQVEMRPNGTPFSGAMTHESIFGASGSQASVNISGLAGSYHWQARAVDSNGATSAWIANGGSPDFTANAGGGATPIDTRDAPNGDCSGASAGGTDLQLLLAGLLAIGLLAAAVMPRSSRGD